VRPLPVRPMVRCRVRDRRPGAYRPLTGARQAQRTPQASTTVSASTDRQFSRGEVNSCEDHRAVQIGGSGALTGAEQYFGSPQQYGFQPPSWPQGFYGPQLPYGQPQGPVQSPYATQAPSGFSLQNAGTSPQQVQQLVRQLAGQILPIAQQMILPQVVAQAVQLVQQQAQQLITQLAVSQLTGQQPYSMPQWQPFGTPQAPGMGTRQYSLLS
jgi:hypothetical protein